MSNPAKQPFDFSKIDADIEPFSKADAVINTAQQVIEALKPLNLTVSAMGAIAGALSVEAFTQNLEEGNKMGDMLFLYTLLQFHKTELIAAYESVHGTDSTKNPPNLN